MSAIAAYNPADRYLVHNIRWQRRGPREGLLRRRRWQQRVWKLGSSAHLEVAAQILAHAPLFSDEAIYLYDNERGGARVGARFGQGWKDG